MGGAAVEGAAGVVAATEEAVEEAAEMVPIPKLFLLGFCPPHSRGASAVLAHPTVPLVRAIAAYRCPSVADACMPCVLQAVGSDSKGVAEAEEAAAGAAEEASAVAAAAAARTAAAAAGPRRTS